MENVDQVISFFGIKPNHTVRRMLRKQLDRWIETKKNIHNLNCENSYQVRFEQKVKNAVYFCHARIQIGNCMWEGYDVGRSVQEALFRVLKHMTITFPNPQTKIQFVEMPTVNRSVA